MRGAGKRVTVFKIFAILISQKTKRGRGMKVSELTRLLKKCGCRFARHGGGHDVWENPKTGQEADVPRHGPKEIPTGTAQGILKKLGPK